MSVGPPVTNSGAGTASPVMPATSGVAGDIVMGFLSVDNVGSHVTGPGGWTTLHQSNPTTDGHLVWIGWKRLAANDAATTVGLGNAGGNYASATVPLSGRHAVNPPVLGTVTTQNTGQASGSTVSATAVAALAGDDILDVILPDVTSGTTTTTTASFSSWTAGMTEIVDFRGPASPQAWGFIGVAKDENVAAGSTGNKSAVVSASTGTFGYVTALIRIPWDGTTGGGADVRNGSSSTGSKSQATSTGSKVASGMSVASAKTSQTATAFKSAATTSTVQARGLQTASGTRRALSNSAVSANEGSTASTSKIAAGTSIVSARGVVVSSGSQPGQDTRNGSSSIRARGVSTSTGTKIVGVASVSKARGVVLSTGTRSVAASSTVKARTVTTGTATKRGLVDSVVAARGVANLTAFKRSAAGSLAGSRTGSTASTMKFVLGEASVVFARPISLSVSNQTILLVPDEPPVIGDLDRPHLRVSHTHIGRVL